MGEGSCSSAGVLKAPVKTAEDEVKETRLAICRIC